MRVAVVGGGLVGLFTSYYLAAGGASTTIYDVEPRGGRASENNAGLITPSFAATPRLSMAVILNAIVGRAGLVRVSMLEVVKSPRWFIKAIRSYGKGDEVVRSMASTSLEIFLEFIRREGIDVDLVRGVVAAFKSDADAREFSKYSGGKVLDSRELSEMGYMGLGGGVYVEEEVSINPLKLYWGLRRKVEEMGSRIIREEVLAVGETPSGPAVMLKGGREVYDRIVIAAGSRCGEVCKSLGYDPMVAPARGIAALFDTSARVVSAPALLEDYGVGVAQHGENTLRITGFFELAGHSVRGVEARLRELSYIAGRHIKGFSSLGLRSVGMGFRPCAADLMPVVGEIPGVRGVYIATGLCRLGVTMAPIVGSTIASLVLGLQTPLDRRVLDAISPSRFSRKRAS